MRRSSEARGRRNATQPQLLHLCDWGRIMQKMIFLLLVIALAAWVVADALYWGSSGHPSLFPNPRYIALVAIGIAVAGTLWGLIYILGKIVSRRTRKSG
jgi:hypothetical protein